MRTTFWAAAAVVVGAAFLIPAAAAQTQASIAGVVRDSSGAVLPGVTVEAASPSLIEKVRSVVTNDAGQYRIEALVPGVYAVTFTLPGFTSVRRVGIELAGSFSAQVNAEMAVGVVEERIDVLLSGVFQSLQGVPLAANYNVPNAQVAPSLGRSLSGGAANATVNLVTPGTLFGDRVNQVDLRIAKLLRYAGDRLMLNVDIFNALNANPVLTENSSFAVWRTPTDILTARFVRFSVQYDF